MKEKIENTIKQIQLKGKDKKKEKEYIRKFVTFGGITNKENYIKTSKGYQDCITIYEFEPLINELLFLRIKETVTKNRKNVIVKIDLADFEDDLDEIADKQINENNTNINSTDKISEANKNLVEKETLSYVYNQVTNYGEKIKKLQYKIYVYEKTLKELEKTTNKIIEELKTKHKVKSVVELGNALQDYKNLFFVEMNPYNNPITETIARNYLFNISNFNDKTGFYFGKTNNNGLVKIDFNVTTEKRASYDIVIYGKKGFGKTMLMKSIMYDNLLSGGKNIIFDIEGIYLEDTKKANGVILSLENRDYGFNILQVLPVKENSTFDEAYKYHRTRLTANFKYMFGDEFSSKEIKHLISICQNLYYQYGFFTSDNWNSIKPPKLSDLSNFIKEKIKKINNNVKNELYENYLELLDEYINPFAYGEIFNVDTFFDFKNKNMIAFDLRAVKQFEPHITDLLLYNVNSIAWNEVLQNKGKKGMIRVFFDEDHRFMHPDAPKESLDTRKMMIHEIRKYNGGLVLATHSPREHFGSGEGQFSDDMKIMLGLMTYRIFYNMDDFEVGVLRKLYPHIPNSYFNQVSNFERGRCLLDIDNTTSLIIKHDLNQEEIMLYNLPNSDEKEQQ